MSLRPILRLIRDRGAFVNIDMEQFSFKETTLQILAVDAEEAEWCLDILEEMFDHYYVKPAQAKARKAALDAKLTASGKPRAKHHFWGAYEKIS